MFISIYCLLPTGVLKDLSLKQNVMILMKTTTYLMKFSNNLGQQ